MKQPEKVYLIDTNVILRYLLGDHQRFSPRAKIFMQDVATGIRKAEIPSVVIVECIYVLQKYYKIAKNEIVDALNRILNFKGIVNRDRSEILSALIKFGETNIDIVDCILAAQSTPNKVIVSFDKDFSKLKAVSENI